MLSTMLWANAASGNWDVTNNWVNQANPADHHVPIASDDAEIDYAGITVTFSSGASDSVNNLTNQATLDLSSGTLNVTGTIQSSGGQLNLQGATLSSATIAAGTTLAGQNGILDGVTVNGTLAVSGNNGVTVEDGLTLDGTLTLGNSSTYGSLYFASATNTLGGSGTVDFSGPGPYNAVGLASGTLTIGPGITVQGQTGYVGYSPGIGGSPSSITVVNQGTIQANVSGGTITVQDASTPNTGTLQATNGGTLSLQSSSFTPGGVIEADTGSTITIGGTIDNTGGTFSPTGSGTVAITGTVDGGTVDVGTGTNLILAGSTLNGVTLSGNYQLAGSNDIYIENNLTLDGTLTLGNSSTYGSLYFASATNTLGGSGTVDFSGPGPYNAVGLASGTLTIGPGITVQGQTGYVGYSPGIGGSPSSITVVNQGTIQANVSGGTITVQDASTPNTGTLQATNGGTLSLQSSSFTPGGVIEADTGSTITIGGTIDNTGGTFSPTGSGTVAITGTVDGGTVDVGTGTNLILAGSTLNAVTLSGNYQLAGSNDIYIENNLTLDGTLTLGNSSTYGSLYFASATNTLGGSGTVDFSGPGPYNAVGLASGTLTIGPGITVQGQTGYVGYSPGIGGSPSSITVVNQGTIQANVSGGTITVQDASTPNTGTLQATNGGTLSLQSSSFTPGGVIEADTGSTITIGGTIDNTGGTFSPTGSGTVAITGTVDGGTVDVGTGTNLILAGTVDGVTLNGNALVSSNGQLTVKDGLILDGTVTIANGDNGLYFVGTQALGGTGTIVFGDEASPYYTYYNYIYTDAATTTLTIDSGITIQGKYGVLGGYYASYNGYNASGGPIVNQGTIAADVSGGTVTLMGTGWQNTGTLEATNGGSLSLLGSNWSSTGVNSAGTGSTFSLGGTDNNANEILTLSGPGSFQASGLIIDGGTLSIANGNSLDYSSGTLDGVDVEGNLSIGGQLTVKDGLILDGTVTIADGDNGLYFVGTQALGGTGTIVFGDEASPYYTYYNYIYTDAATTTLTIDSGITIQGKYGVLGGYYASYNGYNASGGPIVNQGTIAADVSGGTVTLMGTGWQNTGTLEATNGGSLSLLGSNWSSTGVNSAGTGSTFSLGGTDNNANEILTLSGPGSFQASGLIIDGGTLSIANGNSLDYSSGTLDGVDVEGNLSIGGQLTVKDGLILDGTVTIADGDNGLYFVGTQALGGTGTIVFGDEASPYYTYYNYIYTDAATTTLTIDSGITIQGKYGVLGGYYASYNGYNASGGPIVNQGTIAADVSGGTVTLMGTGWQNTGTLQATNGGILNLLGSTLDTGEVQVNTGGQRLER